MQHPISSMESRIALAICGVLVVTYLSILAVKSWRRFRRAERPEIRSDHLVERFKSAIFNIFSHKRMVKNGYLYRGLLHLFIFTADIILLLDNACFMLQAGAQLLGFSPDLELGYAYGHLADSARLLCLIGLSGALINRVIIRPPNMARTADAYRILAFICGLMLLELFSQAFLVAGNVGAGGWLSSLIASAFTGLSSSAIETGYQISWWLHFACLFGFICYIPLSKHLHIATAPLNLLFAARTPKGQLRSIDFEKAEEEFEKSGEEPHFGVQTIRDLSWKQALDGLACTECGRCTNHCPAHRAGSALEPMEIIRNVRRAMRRSDMPVLTKEIFSPELLADCTTCRACMEICPVKNEHVPLIVDLRRSLTMNEGNLPTGASNALKNLERKQNPWGLPKGDRMKWALNLQIAKWDKRAPADYLLFVGCHGAFDDQGQKITRALAILLQKAGVSFAVLGSDEPCCGEVARRLGDEYLYQSTSDALAEKLKKLGVKRVITACAHCFNTLKNESPAKDELQVTHHSQFLAELIEKGVLKPEQKPGNHIVFHDPCYLGRYNSEYDAPRKVVKSCGSLVEADSNHHLSFCCGGGGGQMWTENSIRPNQNRYDDLAAQKPELIATACGFCATELTDAARAKNSTIKVRDIAEILLDACSTNNESEQSDHVA